MTQFISLAIEGAIGVGKTTLARLLQPRFRTELLLEAFEANPFLSGFYADRIRYAFQTQIFFLLSRYEQQQAIAALLARSPIIADYTFAKDSLFAHLNLQGDELDVYKQLYDVLADSVPAPDLVIYLRADTDVLMSRIATRDRAYEREMDQAYIESLRQAYDRYFSTYTQTPLLTIDTDDLNYVQDPTALAFVEGQVRTALEVGAYQKPLPQMEPIAPSRTPTTLAETTCGTRITNIRSRWDTVAEFLAANEAIGRVGAVIAESTEGWSKDPKVELKTAMQDAMTRLQRLARTVGVDPRETQSTVR